MKELINKFIYLFTYLHIHLFNQSIIHFNLNFRNYCYISGSKVLYLILLYYIGFNIHRLNISGTRRRQPRRQQTQDGGRAVDEETSYDYHT